MATAIAVKGLVTALAIVWLRQASAVAGGTNSGSRVDVGEVRELQRAARRCVDRYSPRRPPTPGATRDRHRRPHAYGDRRRVPLRDIVAAHRHADTENKVGNVVVAIGQV
jgi:hypothetical protein